MFKKFSLVTITTIIFVIALVIFEFIHRQTDQTAADIPAEYLQPVDVMLPTGFIEQLEPRQGNALGPDLGY